MRSCRASHPRDPAPWRSPIALSQRILNAAHNRPIACHRDSLTAEGEKEEDKSGFSEALAEGEEEINLGGGGLH